MKRKIDGGYRSESDVSFNYDKEQISDSIKILKNMLDREDIDSLSKAVDPNILKWLAANSQKFDLQINDYLDILSGKKTDTKIMYNLKDIYNSNLDYKQIKNMNKFAKTAQKVSNGIIQVEKDSLLKRALGNIKKRIEYTSRKLLSDKEKDLSNKSSNKGKNPKDRIADKKIDIKNYAVMRFPRTTKFVRNAKKELAVAGTKIVGNLKGESKLATESREKAVRESFVPKAKVDEKAAVEKVEASQRQNEEVIIENPDGTKQIGHRLDDENTK